MANIQIISQNLLAKYIVIRDQEYALSEERKRLRMKLIHLKAAVAVVEPGALSLSVTEQHRINLKKDRLIEVYGMEEYQKLAELVGTQACTRVRVFPQRGIGAVMGTLERQAAWDTMS